MRCFYFKLYNEGQERFRYSVSAKLKILQNTQWGHEQSRCAGSYHYVIANKYYRKYYRYSSK